MRFIPILGALLFSALFAATVFAAPVKAGPLKALFGCSETPHGACTISYSRGGQVAMFQDAAAQAVALDMHIVFAGSCDSACTLFADMLRERSCITQAAEFGFHKFARWPGGSVSSTGETPAGVQPLSYYTPTYSPELEALLKPYGNLPDSEPLVYIHADKAASVWAMCH
ncbi:MAG: hypothetical protein WDM84_01020 [Bauldia sp.]